jgi:hypothetical protein
MGGRLRAWDLKQAGWQQCQIAAALLVTEGAVRHWLSRGRTGGLAALRPGQIAFCVQGPLSSDFAATPPNDFGVILIYVVRGNGMYVPAGATLTLPAGTLLKFMQANAPYLHATDVKGTMVAQGKSTVDLAHLRRTADLTAERAQPRPRRRTV